MKRLAAILLLSACHSEAPTEGNEQVEQSVVPAAAPGAQDPAQLRQRVIQAMTAILPDAASARYGDVRSGTGGAICGTVEAKQGKAAGFRPFVVTPQGVAVISTAPRILYDDPSDIFADYYIRWCASPEELRRLGPELQSAAGSLPPVPPPDLSDPGPAMAPADTPAPPPPGVRRQEADKSAPPAPTQPAASADEDSFSKAVLRKHEGK
jgi:hypothetical protein